MFIRVLGRVGFGIDPLAVTPVTERVTATVLAHLASAGGRALAPEVLIAAVWDRPTRTSRNAVQVAVTKLRRSLGQHCVVADRAGYALRTGLVRVDWWEANEAESMARELCRQGAYQRALSEVDRAITLFDDIPFAGLHSCATAALREQAERTLRSLTVLRARCLLAGGRAGDAVAPLRRALAHDQLDEPVVALLVEALARAGRTADALAAFHDLRLRLRDELGIRPSDLVMTVFNQVLTDSLPSAGGAGRSVGGLSAPASPMFGRDADTAQISALVEQGHRLVTIIGAGGLGKSTVAILAARAIVNGHERPAVMVDLTLCTRSEDVVTVATKVLDPGMVGLATALEGVAPVVILDNAEHVVVATRDLVHRLLLISGVDVLVTSRRSLGLKDERLFELGPLVGDGEGTAALALLLDRAGGTAARQSAADLRILQQVAAMADGVPLVLELFAAALRWRSPVELLADLDGRVDLATGRVVTGQDGDRPARHRTVAAVVDWSLGQLDSAVVSALAALTVIRGQFDERAAAAVIRPAADTPIAKVLTAVLDVSLLQRIPQPGRVTFRMLEPVRDGIRASSMGRVADAVHAAHAKYFLDRIRHADDLSADHANTYRGLKEWDQGNVLPALSWLWEHDRPAAMGRLPSVIRYWTPNTIDDDTYFRWVDSALEPGNAFDQDRGRAAIARFEAMVFFRNERPDEILTVRAVIAQCAAHIEGRWKYRLNSAEGGWARAHDDLAAAIALFEATEPAGVRDRVVRDARVAECHWYAGNHQRAVAALDATCTELQQLQDYALQRAVLSTRMFLSLQDADTDSAQLHLALLQGLVKAQGDDADSPDVLSHAAWLDIECARFDAALNKTSHMLTAPEWLLVPVHLLEVVMLTAFGLLGIGAHALAAPAAALARELDSHHPGSLNPYARKQLRSLPASDSVLPELRSACGQDAGALIRTLIDAGRRLDPPFLLSR